MIGRIFLITILGLNFGCASFNAFDRVPIPRKSASSNAIDVRHGRPNQFIDGAGQILGTPNKLVLWDRRADNHQVTPETVSALLDYMNQYQLNDVLVRVNQYDPIDEWRRMVRNDEIRPFWRLTFGNYNLLKYSLLPGRLFGGDWYNPYTDTIHLYSDIPALAISETAYALDIRSRLNPGAYAALKEIPIVGMAHETTANNYTIDYYKQHLPDALPQARRVLDPNYGADWGGQLFSVLPYGTLVGRLVGAAVGRIANAFRSTAGSEAAQLAGETGSG